MDNRLFERLAITESGVEKHYDWKGKQERFVIAQIANFAEYEKIARHTARRANALRLKKNKLPVVLPQAMAAPWLEVLGEHRVLDNGDVEVYLTTKAEVYVATRLELGIREPDFTWAGAVLLLKLNFRMAAQVVADFSQINGEDAKAEAKKGSKTTDGELEDSEV